MNPLFLTLLAGLGLVAHLPAAATDSHDLHQHDAASATLQLDKGKKWPTDAPLRQAMTAMRADLAGKLHAIHKGSLAKDDYAALGRAIEGRIGVIVNQCKLEPRADAMLHVVIGELGGAADVMQDKAPGDPAEAAHRAAMTLNDYGRHFAHPGWKAIK